MPMTLGTDLLKVLSQVAKVIVMISLLQKLVKDNSKQIRIRWYNVVAN